MIQTTALLNRLGYQKIDDLKNEIDSDSGEIASILDLEPELVGEVLRLGKVPDRSDRDSVDDRFFMLLTIFDYLLNLAHYDRDQFRELWQVAPATYDSVYSTAIVKPPWHESGIQTYLRRHRSSGLRACIVWIRDH